MKKLKRSVSVLLSILMVMSIFTALPVTVNADTTYTITRYNDDGFTLKTTTAAEGQVLDYGDPPSKTGNGLEDYTFAGWDTSILPICLSRATKPIQTVRDTVW